MSLLEVSDLRTEIQSRGATVRPVDNVSFSVGLGETVGLVGESGSGKTMTGMSILRLLPPGGSIVGGSIRFDGRELTTLDEVDLRRLRGNEIAMIFQDPMTSLNPTRTIGSQLREAYRTHRGGSKRLADRRAIEVLSLVGLPRPVERLGDYPYQLSGGMRQRVMIAIALVCEPKLLIADEPTTALDVSIQAQILELLDDLKSRLGMGVLLVTHDLGVIAGYADRVVVMYAGRVAEQASTQDLFTDPRHRYTEALFESMPTLQLDSGRELATIAGMPPKLVDLEPQCRFAPRCRYVQPDCVGTDPGVFEVKDDHFHSCLHPYTSGVDGALIERSEDRAIEENRDVVEHEVLVELIDVEKTFPIRSGSMFGQRRELQAVSKVSLTIESGETLGLVGESGCGKTTIGRMLVGLDSPTGGRVLFQGRDLRSMSAKEFRRRRKDLQIMFQDSSAALDPRMTVSSLIEEPLVVQRTLSRRERASRVTELLEAVGLSSDAGSRYAHEFSGGQRQRVAMARALALRPKIIVADEPVSALDVSVQAQILNLMRRLQQDYGLTYVVISHDLSLLKYMANRIGVMYLGKLVEVGSSDEVYGSPRHHYTAGLIKAIPIPEPSRDTAAGALALGGELPSAIDPPSGCRFRTRCPSAAGICAIEEPPLRRWHGAHAVACHFPIESVR